MGSIFGSSQTTNSTTKTDTGPWKYQQPFLKGAFSEAGRIYDSQKGTAPYSDPLYAGINGMQATGANTGFINGGSIAGTVPGTVGAGMTGINGVSPFMTGAGALASGNFDMGSTAANSAMAGMTPYSLGQASQGLNAGLGYATTDPTQGNIAAANAYANNPAINGQIDAALTDVRRNLGENVLPSINASAVASGNMNSSRAGVAEGLALRGAGETAANIAAGIRGDAYQRGLQLGETARQANMGGALAAGNAWGDMAGAGATGENNANANRLANLQVQQGGLSMLGQGAQLGAGLLSSAGNAAQTGAGLQTEAGAVYQGDAQNKLTEKQQLWQMAQDQPWSPLARLMGIVGSANWGQNGTSQTQSTTTTSGNPIGGILGTALGGASLFAGGGPFAGAFGSLSNIFSPIKMGSK